MKLIATCAALALCVATAQAREPILVPVQNSLALQQAVPDVPPVPGTLPPRTAPGTYVVPGEKTLDYSYSPQAYRQPMPMTVQPGMMPPGMMQPGVIVGDASMGLGMPLYPDVKVRQPRNIAPCAVSKIVAVPDPCNECLCTFIEICVPPCACENVICKKNKVRFDYGKYSVDVTARRGILVVNYND